MNRIIHILDLFGSSKGLSLKFFFSLSWNCAHSNLWVHIIHTNSGRFWSMYLKPYISRCMKGYFELIFYSYAYTLSHPFGQIVIWWNSVWDIKFGVFTWFTFIWVYSLGRIHLREFPWVLSLRCIHSCEFIWVHSLRCTHLGAFTLMH